MIKRKRFLVPALVLVLNMLAPQLVGATPTPSFNQASIVLGRLGAGAGGVGSGNTVLVLFKLRTAATSVTSLTLTFPSGFNVPTATATASTTGFPNATITAAPGSPLTATATTAGTNLGGTIVVTGFTSASFNTTSLFGFILPETMVTNPTTGAAQYILTLTSKASSTVEDNDNLATYITTGSTSDQVTVNASVAPYFSFSLGGNADTIPAIDKSSVQTSPGVSMTVSTNAPLGYTAYVKSANGGLRSANASYLIPTGTYNTTPDTITAGTSEYAFVPTSSALCVGGCGAATPVFDGEYAGLTAGSVTSPSTAGSFNSTSFSSFVSRASYTASDTYLLQERLAVSGSVPYATDYTDTLTVVAAGNF
jgi:hypothetical protein